jgi:hypothetical protein
LKVNLDGAEAAIPVSPQQQPRRQSVRLMLADFI